MERQRPGIYKQGEVPYESAEVGLGEKSFEKGLVEIKKRRTGGVFLAKNEEAIFKIQEMITES